jgi:transposase
MRKNGSVGTNLSRLGEPQKEWVMNSETSPAAASEKVQAWAGQDVSKATFEAALWLPLAVGAARDLRDLPVRVFPRTPEGAREFLAWADAHLAPYGTAEAPQPVFRVVMEATGKYSEELAVWLLAERLTVEPAIINPQMACHFRKSLAFRNNTDAIAARALARYGADRRPARHEPLSKEHAELRDLSRYRQTLVEEQTAEKNRAGEGSQSPLVCRMQQRRLRKLARDIERIEKEMKKALAKLPDLQRDAELIDGIYGVGFITAAAVVAELGDLRRFSRSRQLTAFVGTAPCNQESGSSVRKRPRMSKAGEPRVRALLYMCAMSTVGGDNEFADLYHRLLRNGKNKKAALGAIMRKLLVVMRAIVISGEPYQPHFNRRPGTIPCPCASGAGRPRRTGCA